MLGTGILLLGVAGGCGDDETGPMPSPDAGSDAVPTECGLDPLGTNECIGDAEPNFTDTPSCISFLETADVRGEDVDGDYVPDGDDDSSNDGLDDWGRPLLDDETRCGCENAKCLETSLACQDNIGCREISICALSTGCRSIRECFWGDGWPGGVGPCREIIDKWGAQSVSAALGEEISRCMIAEECPDRKCPCAPDDDACPTREEQTCPVRL